MDAATLEFLKASPALAIALVVWFALRDLGKTLRSIDVRLYQLLERERARTPPEGVPIPMRRERSKPTRARSIAESDGTELVLPRTLTDEDIDGGGGG